MPERLNLESGSTGQHNFRVHPIRFKYPTPGQVTPYLSGDVFGQDEPQEDIDYSPVADDNAAALEARQLLLHSKIFTLAHIYDIPRLRQSPKSGPMLRQVWSERKPEQYKHPRHAATHFGQRAQSITVTCY